MADALNQELVIKFYEGCYHCLIAVNFPAGINGSGRYESYT